MRFQTATYVTLGASLLSIGLVGGLLHRYWRPPTSNLSSAVQLQTHTFESQCFAIRGQTFCDLVQRIVPIALFIHVEAPKVIYTGGSYSVIASVTIQTKTPLSSPSKLVPQLQLSGAGVEIVPKDWLSLSPDKPAKWSVAGTEPGEYSLVMNFKPTSPTDPNDSGTKLVFSPSSDISLTVERRWRDWVAQGWPIFAAFMGSLLTLPGILAFLKDRKNEKLDPIT
jgi:hypothetical protein